MPCCVNARRGILAASREILNVAGEVAFRVPPLTTPDPNHLPSSAALTQYEAVQLFVERAVTTALDFAVTDNNAPAVAQVCHRLDGIPLAIELAAARVRVLTVEQIAARLDDSFRLLTDGSRAALPRHQTLRATIDWSYSLLSPEEKMLFRRLSVFAGGWMLEAAEVVWRIIILGRDHRCTDTSGREVSKLLRYNDRRYSMLEIIQQYVHTNF
jgi:non-specific serine/threonine protein kinase